MAVRKLKGAWWIDFYIGKNRHREKVGLSRQKAERLLKEIRSGHQRNRVFPERINNDEGFSFNHLIDFYIRDPDVKQKKSFKRDILSISHLKGFFTNKKLSEIKPSFIKLYIGRRRKDYVPNAIKKKKLVSNSTINRELACLKHMLNKAVELGMLRFNPIGGIKLLKENPGREKYLQKSQVKALIKGCAPHLKPMVLVELNSGMRRGELLRLKWSNVDFDNNVIRLKPEQTKTSKGRAIPMNSILKATLKSIKRNPNSEYIFCKKDGSPYGDIKKSFATALRKANIKDFRFHDLRHHYASMLVMNEVNIRVVQDLLGHKSITTTQKYSHLSLKQKQKAVELLCK